MLEGSDVAERDWRYWEGLALLGGTGVAGRECCCWQGEPLLERSGAVGGSGVAGRECHCWEAESDLKGVYEVKVSGDYRGGALERPERDARSHFL